MKSVKIAGGIFAGLIVLGGVSSALGLGGDQTSTIDGGRFRDAYAACRITAENLGGRPVEKGSPADQECIDVARDEARTP